MCHKYKCLKRIDPYAIYRDISEWNCSDSIYTVLKDNKEIASFDKYSDAVIFLYAKLSYYWCYKIT